jgi:catechol 2,3-dioxygenase
MGPIDPSLRIGSVALGVSDLPRSADFYERVLGLPLIASEEGSAQLGPDPEHPALELTQIAGPTPLFPSSAGLYHVAWLHPTRSSLADSLRRVAETGWHFEGASDHGVSEALYLSDPDGLGIELYVDRPREQWERPPGGNGVNIVTLPLDLEDLLAQSSHEPTPAVPAETALGHVHLKVSEVPGAAAFYRDAIGFEEQAQLPSAAFLSAGGYHHHVGLNSWQSAGAAPAADSAPGLRRIGFELAGPEAIDALEQRLGERPTGTAPVRDDGGALRLRDPDGQLLEFQAR